MKKMKSISRLMAQQFECLHFSVSKDETRRMLMGIIHYEPLEALVSTNGQIATVLKSHYEPSLKGMILDKNFQVIKREYPRIETAIPSLEKSKLERYIIQKEHYQNKNCDENKFLCFYANGETRYTLEKDCLFKLSRHYLKPLADGEKYAVRYFDSRSPVLFGLDDPMGTDSFRNFMLIMPVRI